METIPLERIIDKAALFTTQDTHPAFKLLTPFEFLADLSNQLTTASDRFYLQAMLVEADHVGFALTGLLKKAALRGLDSRLNADYYSLMVTNGKIDCLQLFEPKNSYNKVRKRAKKEMYKRMSEKDGVAVNLTNRPHPLFRTFPFVGRNHIKIALVDNVGYLGGTNFSDNDFSRADFMIRIEDEEAVGYISDQFHRINGKKRRDDVSIKVSSTSELLIDSGKPGRSIILSRAINLVKAAQKKVRLITPFLPEGELMKSLEKSYKSGVDVEITIAGKFSEGDVSSKILIARNNIFLFLKRPDLPIFRYPNPLHAKALIADNTVIFGSHNFLLSGVLAGTTEMSFLVNDPSLLFQVERFYTSLQAKDVRNSVSV